MTRHKNGIIITATFMAWIAAMAGIYAWVSTEQSAQKARARQEQAQPPAQADKPSKP